MKKIALTIFTLLFGLHVIAQQTDNPGRKQETTPTKREPRKRKEIKRPLRCPAIYIGTSSGINNNTGYIGGSIDFPIAKFFSVEGGIGTSTWGIKVSAMGKYYLSPCQRGWAFGVGVTHSTGLQNFEDKNLETVNGTEDVTLNLNPQTNICLAAFYYWNLGRRYNRFYLEAGWSVPLSTGNKFDQLTGDPLTNNSVNALNLISPGGLIIAAGFSFGVH